MVTPIPVSSSRIPTFYPSAASCRDEHDPNLIHGSCLRQQWYRCSGHKESNPSNAYNHYIFAAGNMWEDWLTEQCKQMGIWLANSVKWSIRDYYISGEIDILIKDDDGKPVIIENKTYNASNYNAKKSICGLGGTVPTPKYQNAMQAALYLSYFSKPENGGVERVILTYMDRSCSDPKAQMEFEITLNPVGDKTYIHVECYNSSGLFYSYDIPGITMEGIFSRYQELMDSLKNSLDIPPKADFYHIYPEDMVEEKFSSGEISKTAYEKYKKDPSKNPIGHWLCMSYCNYRDLCKVQKDIDGDL